MRRIIRTASLMIAATALLLALPPSATAHSDRGEKRPKTFAEAFISMTEQEAKQDRYFRHPPGNVRAEDMYELFTNRVIVVDAGRDYSTIGAPNHALKVIFIGRDNRYLWCSYGDDPTYYLRDHNWAPTKVKHDGTYSPRLDPAVHNDNPHGLSPLYDGDTGRIVFYRHRNRTWHTWNVGHLQERLPRAVWTLCPDFPSAEELGVGVNEKQTAVTYDRLLEQDPGRRVLRPDLITPDPTEVIE